MNEQNNGGPAFPNKAEQCNFGYELSGGMTLRDYFAAKAMQGLLANPNVVGHNPMTGWSLVNCDTEDIAAFARMQADSMIKARG